VNFMSFRTRRFESPSDMWATKTKNGQFNEMVGIQAYSSTTEVTTRIPFLNNIFRDWTRNRQYKVPSMHGTYDYDDGTQREHRQEWAKKVFNLTFDIMKHYVAPEDRILDVCCGSGWQMDQLHKRGYTNVVGIDADAAQLDYARKKRPHLELVNSFFGPKENDISCDTMLWFDSVSRIPYHFNLFDAIDRCARKFVIINSQEACNDAYRDPHYNLAKRGWMLLEKRTVTEDDKNTSGNDDFKPFGTIGMDRPIIDLSVLPAKRLFRSVCLFMRV